MNRIKRLKSRIIRESSKHVLAYYGKTYGSYDLFYEAELAVKTLNTMNHACPVILDVGANKGNYTDCLFKQFSEQAIIHCFEPSQDHAESLTRLENIYNGRLHVHRIALSSSAGTKTLYKDQPGSGLASLYERDIACHGLVLDHGELITSTTLDSWAEKHNIENISFLKVDVEGHELDVFKGGEKILSAGKINAIQFEFGGCNIDSKTYVKDFHKILVSDNGYSLYRIAPSKNLVDLNHYNESLECFSWQNLIAFRSKIFIPPNYSIIFE